MSSLKIKNLNVWYGGQHALKNINVELPLKQVTAIIGPSGCGKSTLLKSLNRLLDENEAARVDGEVWLEGENVYAPSADITEIRTRIGLLAQKPFPLPMSIYDNVAYGPRIHGRPRPQLAGIVQTHLQAVGLWDEVSARLKSPATSLSVGNNNGSAWHGLWPWNPMCCCAMNPPPRSTLSRRGALKRC